MTRVTMDKLEALAFDYRIPMERHGQTWRVILPGVRTYYAVIA